MTMIARKGEWLSAPVNNTLLMMNAERENYVGLDEIGAWIWGQLENPLDLDQLYARIVLEFDVEPDQVRADTEPFLRILVEHGAITIDPSLAA